MSRYVLLDAAPLGMVTNPKPSSENLACRNWLADLADRGARAVIPEIADYEVRRELLRGGKTEGIARLDALRLRLSFAPITTPVMLQAATLWAEARRIGRPAAGDASLDADMILAAHAVVLALQGHDIVIATTNVRHLEPFVSARHWREVH